MNKFIERWYVFVVAAVLMFLGAIVVTSGFGDAAVVTTLIACSLLCGWLGYIFRGNEYIIDTVQVPVEVVREVEVVKEVVKEVPVEKVVYVNENDLCDVIPESRVKKSSRKKKS